MDSKCEAANKKLSSESHPLQVLPQVHEHPHACVDAVLLRLQHQVLLLLGRQQRLVEVGFPLQLPVLADEVDQALGEAQGLGQLLQLDQAVELLLQLLQPLGSQTHLLCLCGGFGPGGAQARLPSFALAVLEAVRLELDLVALVQDGLHLQAVLEGTRHVERSRAVLHRALTEDQRTNDCFCRRLFC